MTTFCSGQVDECFDDLVMFTLRRTEYGGLAVDLPYKVDLHRPRFER